MMKIVEIVGVSSESYSDAVKKAVEEFSNSGNKVLWFEVVEHRGAMRNDKVEFQAVIKIGTV
ncbi:MAG: hypothetical protein Kow00108_01490 [Calditrichia bacterium]